MRVRRGAIGKTRARERDSGDNFPPAMLALFFFFLPPLLSPSNSTQKKKKNEPPPVIKEFGKSIGVDTKQVQGLIRLAKKNGEKLGFLA